MSSEAVIEPQKIDTASSHVLGQAMFDSAATATKEPCLAWNAALYVLFLRLLLHARDAISDVISDY